MNPMPGVEVGDIGPKIGFHSKDNGYLILKNVVIPRKNMLRRFVSVSKAG
jgi:acyl-CoA oxidase